MAEKNSFFLLNITIPLLIAAVSFFILADLTSASDYTDKIIASIDESREDVLKLTAASTAVSVAITALPGDLATPVADNLAELGKGFLVVLCALYLEKFLISVMGILTFKWMVPIACLIYIAGFLLNRNRIRQLSYRILGLALTLFLIIPAGTGISGLIQERYGETIDQTLESAESCAGLLRESVQDTDGNGEAGNGLAQVLRNLQQSGDKIARGTSQFMKYLEKLISYYMEVTAVMIVTSCVIPILIVLCFFWILKMIFSSDADQRLLSRMKEMLKKEGNE